MFIFTAAHARLHGKYAKAYEKVSQKRDYITIFYVNIVQKWKLMQHKLKENQ